LWVLGTFFFTLFILSTVFPCSFLQQELFFWGSESPAPPRRRFPPHIWADCHSKRRAGPGGGPRKFISWPHRQDTFLLQLCMQPLFPPLSYYQDSEILAPPYGQLSLFILPGVGVRDSSPSLFSLLLFDFFEFLERVSMAWGCSTGQHSV